MNKETIRLITEFTEAIKPKMDFVEDDSIAEMYIRLGQSLPRIQEEVTELEHSLKDDETIGSREHVVQVLDDVVDILFVAIQQAVILEEAGINVWDALEEVSKNNCSKLLNTEQDAYFTVEHYANHGVECEYHKLEKTGKYVVRRLSDNKLMKGITYKDVQLEKFVPVE